MSRCFSLIVLLLVTNTASAQGLKVEEDKENVVASRLVGKWKLHPELTKRLTGTAEPHVNEQLPALVRLQFEKDASVAGKVPQKYVAAFEERNMKVYLAGFVYFGDSKHPFVLTNIAGNPHVLFWRLREGDVFGDGESFNVMLARAARQQEDLLFVGGDFNNQPFSGYQRVE